MSRCRSTPMTIDPFLPWAVSVMLLTVRLTAAVALSPALSAYGTPASVRIALTFALAALALSNGKPVSQASIWVADPLRLAVPIFVEFGIGAFIGLSTQIVMAGFAIAGRLMDVQIGFSLGSVFDPLTRSNSNVLGMLLSLLAVVLFVATDAHLELIRLVSKSIEVLPIGQIPNIDDPMRPLLAARWMFAIGFALAAPLTMALLLTDITVGVLSRNMPQMNVLMLAIPIKVIVGLAVLSLTVRFWGKIVRQAFIGVATSMGLS